ncbi:FAD-binding oxidoreductase [Rhodospirillaceae bacterium KN72]|uniref:FAD-binding oxidoreductase n=1 Tax=Pacificispira spongiicola TaxID=2729598 RepID=A0A7Y0HGH0_9PROT|nr:FAD-binding oxidoreductase [Pacificispira spongiicola]NMM44349.1 FAD-binding oxidoreductase [Pacificispira spongiicola]
MSPPVDPVHSSETLPAKVDVVVIGGGIIGVSSAWFLARRGFSVALCEKGVIGGEQSSRNWGYCRQQGRDPKELPLILESMRIWRGLDKEIEGDTGFRQAGVAYVAKDEAQLAQYERWAEIAKEYQLDTRVLSRDELKAHIPGYESDYPGGLWTASDGRAEPSKAAPAIATAAQRQGVSVLTGCAVRGLETAAGHVSAVVTERGRIACDAVLLAGGAWSSLFLKRHGIAFPQLSVKSSVMRTTAGPEVLAGGLSTPEFSIRRREDGKYSLSRGFDSTFYIVPDAIRWMGKFWESFQAEKDTIKLRLDGRFFQELFRGSNWSLDRESPFEKVRVLDPAADRGILDAGLADFKKRFPVLKDLGVEEYWAGMIDATPDAVPCIAPMDKLPGLFLASGFSGHGFGIGPGAGRLAADMVTGHASCVDPSPFRYGRFFDGTSLAPAEV